MKIGILSDLHVDINHEAGNPVVQGLKAVMRAKNIDKMIIAGDMASDYELTLTSLMDIEAATGIECLFVPGNHDIWNRKHPSMTSWETYERLKRFHRNLANGPYYLNDDWVVIGDMGWYDYAFGSSDFTIEQFDYMKIDDRLWQDKVMAIWDRPTRAMHDYFYEKLEAQLKEYHQQHIILVIHVIPIQQFTVQNPDRIWSYLNAFLGSPQYGTLALKYNVRYIICGHVHYRRKVRISNSEFICNCLNYSHQWINNDAADEIAQALRCIDIC